MKLVATVFSLVFVCLFTPIARAQDHTASALIDEGMAQRRDGQVTEALATFERASAIDRSPRVVAQLGLTHAMLEHWVLAYGALTEALTATADEWIGSRREALERALAEIRAHLALLRLGGCDGDSHVAIDGHRISIGDGSTIPLEPGVHQVAVRGRANAFEQPLTAVAGETVHVQCSAVSAPQLTSAEPASDGQTQERAEASPNRVARVLGIVSIGLGAVGVGVGVAYQVTREGDVSDAVACGSRYSCYDDAAARANSRMTPMVVSYIAGGALIAAGVITLLLAGTRTDHASAQSFACAPTMDSIGAACTGSF